MSEFGTYSDQELIEAYWGSVFDLRNMLVKEYDEWLVEGASWDDAPYLAPTRQQGPLSRDLYTWEPFGDTETGTATPEGEAYRESLVHEYASTVDGMSISELLEAGGGRYFVVSELEEDEGGDW